MTKGEMILKNCNMLRVTLAVAVLAVSASVNASAASFTTIGTNATEPGLFDSLDSIYGVGNYERISDDFDAVWTEDVLIGAIAVGKWSAAQQRLGFCVVCDGSDSVQLGPTITANGIMSVTLFDGTFTFLGPFRWYDAPFGSPVVGTVYSDPSLNANGTDHMVSFAIKNRPGVFALAFEDWLSSYTGAPSDRDFNDFIVEVRFAVPPSDGELPSVPEPTSIALLGGALLALGLAGARRKRA